MARRVIEGEPTAGKAARLLQTRGAQSVLDVNARTVRIKAFPDAESKKIQIEIEMLDCVVTVAGIESPHENFTRPLTVPMPDPIYALTTRPAKAYIAGSLSVADKQRLRRDLLKLTNSVISELHARVSFAVSCLILVMVGCALGMMFRSGNFLSAFAVSVVPALISIALVVTGQHTCENVPWDI